MVIVSKLSLPDSDSVLLKYIIYHGSNRVIIVKLKYNYDNSSVKIFHDSSIATYFVNTNEMSWYIKSFIVYSQPTLSDSSSFNPNIFISAFPLHFHCRALSIYKTFFVPYLVFNFRIRYCMKKERKIVFICPLLYML